MTIKDSGQRSEFTTGAHRDCQEGKGRMDLLPFWALMEVSKIYEEGAKKYRANNWRRGIPLSRYADSGMRHLAKWMAGWRDEPHLAQATWNFLCLMETQELIRQGLLPEELNDLPYNPLDVLDNPQDIPPLNLGDEGSELDFVGMNDGPSEPLRKGDKNFKAASEISIDDEKIDDVVSCWDREWFNKQVIENCTCQEDGSLVTDEDIERCTEKSSDEKDDRRFSITDTEELEAIDSLETDQLYRLYSTYTLEQIHNILQFGRMLGLSLDNVINGLDRATADVQRIEEISRQTGALRSEALMLTSNVAGWMQDLEYYSKLENENAGELTG